MAHDPLGSAANPSAVSLLKLDVTNDEVGTGGTAGQTGALTPYHLVALNTINANVIKASAGRLYTFNVFNSTAGALFVKFYDKATAPDPSAGGAENIPIWIHYAQPSTVAVSPVMFPHGLAFANGLGVVMVALLADTDETAVAANSLILNAAYK